MWTDENRGRYDRSKLRYPSDLTDQEWALVAPEIPPAKRGGNKRTVNIREVVNGIMYILSTGCQWRAIPKDLPPRSTLHDYLNLWDYDGTITRIHHTLYVKCRELAEREPSPTAAIIDSQSVKSAEKGGPVSTRMGTMQARKSMERSAISSSIRKVFFFTPLYMPPISRIGTAECSSWRPCSACIRSCSNSTPTEDIKVQSFKTPSPGYLNRSTSKSSNAPMSPRASPSCPSGGSSSAPSHGSIDAAASQRTGNVSTEKPSPSSASPPSDSCCESYVKQGHDSGQTLKNLARIES